MRFNLREHYKMLLDNDIETIYSGPIWSDIIDGVSEMLIRRLEYDNLPLSASQSIFSVFVEQMNNMRMYSAERETHVTSRGKSIEAARGICVLCVSSSEYCLQTGNVITPNNAKILRERIDYLNTLSKEELRKYYKQQLYADNANSESKGAGIGLIDIARRASCPIDYHFEQLEDDLLYFSMYITIKQAKEGQ